MINYIKNKWNEHQEAKKAEVDRIESNRVSEVNEDLRISNDNARYLRGHIKISTSNLIHFKTKAKKATAQKQIDWFEKKLVEELNYISFFENQLA